MRVLITRPRSDAETLAAVLHALGHTTLVEPLIDVHFCEGPDLDLDGVQALIVTSANGVRAAARRTRERTTPLMAVGPATAAEARAHDFRHVHESDGQGAAGLAAFASTKLLPSGGPLLHVTGAVSAGDFEAALAPRGFAVRVTRLYDTRQAQSLSAALADELAAGAIAAAMFYSPRTAAVFSALARAANLDQACARVTALTLSQAVADALRPLAFRRILIASRPDTDAMLGCLRAV